MFRFGGAAANIDINFNDIENRLKKDMPSTSENKDSATQSLPVYEGTEAVTGKVEITIPSGKKLEHLGIKIEMLGFVELIQDRGNSVKFTTLVRELEPAGTMSANKTYPFEFSTEKPYECYSGINVRLRYLIRVTITRSYNGSIVKDADFLVQNVSKNTQDTEVQQPLKMEVGIEECLHIEFEYNKGKYSLQDVVLGKIYFLLVRIKIKHMELAVIRRESSGGGQNSYNESENITKFELMDGAPVKGEVIPIRLYLAPLPLTPTYRSVNNTFSVKYYLNLVLIDEEDRRYFKQQEITLWRKEIA